MEPRTKVFLTFAIAVVLVAGLYIFTNWFSLITGYFTGEDERARVANCLNEQGAEFYGTLYCIDCEKQAEVFGPAFTVISQVDCGRNNENCPNIQSVPAWYLNKNIHYGFKSLEEIKEISGCA